MKKQTALLAFLFLNLGLSGAQNLSEELQPGDWVNDCYIVNLDNDTIYGKILWLSTPQMARKIFFRPEGYTDRKPQRFKASKLTSYFFLGDAWVTKTFKDGTLNLTGKQKNTSFLRLLKQGRLCAYQYYYTELEDELIKAEGNVITLLPEQIKTEIYLEKQSDMKLVSMNHIRFMRFRKGMSKFLKDCEVLAQEIKDKKLKKKNWQEIVDRYNDCE